MQAHQRRDVHSATVYRAGARPERAGKRHPVHVGLLSVGEGGGGDDGLQQQLPRLVAAAEPRLLLQPRVTGDLLGVRRLPHRHREGCQRAWVTTCSEIDVLE